MDDKNKAGLISGHIDIILLKVISLEDGYGYSISKKISQFTDNECEIKEATLYSGLRRLEAEKSIAAYWGDETQGGRRKYYTLTDTGKEKLFSEVEKWKKTKELLEKILNREDTNHDMLRKN